MVALSCDIRQRKGGSFARGSLRVHNVRDSFFLLVILMRFSSQFQSKKSEFLISYDDTGLRLEVMQSGDRELIKGGGKTCRA